MKPYPLKKMKITEEEFEELFGNSDSEEEEEFKGFEETSEAYTSQQQMANYEIV